jgi:histidinol phosphatase-like PHP family hydrolase
MPLTADWHIHTEHSCDGACIPMPTLVREAAAMGIADFGVTDHLHTPYNLPDVRASRQAFDALSPSPRMHFGVEVSCVSQWELDEVAAGRHAQPTYGVRSGGPAGGALAIGLTADDIAAFGIKFVVGGAHWPLYVPLEREAVIRDYHRQNLFLATHPLVTIVAHPWWWMGAWQDADGMYRTDPWFDDFGRIPRGMHDEFAAAAREPGTVVEINLEAILCNGGYPDGFRRQYLDYLASLAAAGVTLSLGSDCHSAHYTDMPFATAAALLATVGLDDTRLWRLPPRA